MKAFTKKLFKSSKEASGSSAASAPQLLSKNPSFAEGLLGWFAQGGWDGCQADLIAPPFPVSTSLLVALPVYLSSLVPCKAYILPMHYLCLSLPAEKAHPLPIYRHVVSRARIILELDSLLEGRDSRNDQQDFCFLRMTTCDASRALWTSSI